MTDSLALPHIPPYAAHIPPWAGQVTSLPPGCSGARDGELCSGYALGCAIYGEQAVPAFAAFAYCWRRFGPPWIGSDEIKELVCYVLHTPHPDVFVTLSLSASPLQYAVGYLVAPAVQATEAVRAREQGSALVRDALAATLTECLRPVFIRDIAINVLGKVPDIFFHTDQRDVCPASVYAGYGIPKAAMDEQREEHAQ